MAAKYHLPPLRERWEDIPPLVATFVKSFAEQLGKHPIGGGALGKAVAVSAVRAGDVVVPGEGFADADRDRRAAHREQQAEIAQRIGVRREESPQVPRARP